MRVIFLSVCAYMCIVNAAKFCSSNSNSQDLSQHHKSVMYQLYLPYISHLALGMGGKKTPTFPTCYHSVNLFTGTAQAFRKIQDRLCKDKFGSLSDVCLF